MLISDRNRSIDQRYGTEPRGLTRWKGLTALYFLCFSTLELYSFLCYRFLVFFYLPGACFVSLCSFYSCRVLGHVATSRTCLRCFSPLEGRRLGAATPKYIHLASLASNFGVRPNSSGQARHRKTNYWPETVKHYLLFPWLPVANYMGNVYRTCEDVSPCLTPVARSDNLFCVLVKIDCRHFSAGSTRRWEHDPLQPCYGILDWCGWMIFYDLGLYMTMVWRFA